MAQILCEACNGMGQVIDEMTVDGNTLDCPVCDGYGYYADDNDAFDEALEKQYEGVNL